MAGCFRFAFLSFHDSCSTSAYLDIWKFIRTWPCSYVIQANGEVLVLAEGTEECCLGAMFTLTDHYSDDGSGGLGGDGGTDEEMRRAHPGQM